MSRVRTSSLPTVLIVVVCAAVAAYVAFFRGKSAPTDPSTPAAAQAPAVRIELKEEKPVPPPPPAPPREAEKKAPPAPPPPRDPAADIDAALAQGDLRGARAKLAPLFSGDLTDAARTDLARKGVEINQKLVVIPPESKEFELYEIQQGDTLEGIARKFKALNGVKGAIMLVNNYKENAILRAGRKVKIPRGTWSIVVDKSLFTLWLCLDGAPFKAYGVAIGTDQKTPAGRFVAGARNPKPAWWPPPESGVKGPVKYGDPANPLGEWWIALEHDLYHGLGIHGTNDPGSIGSKASNGCVRMRNEEVGEIAAIAWKGMVVTVVE